MQVAGYNQFAGVNRFQQAAATPPTDPAKGIEEADKAAKSGGGGDGQKEQILGKIFESLGQKVSAGAEQRTTLDTRRLDMKA